MEKKDYVHRPPNIGDKVFVGKKENVSFKHQVQLFMYAWSYLEATKRHIKAALVAGITF